MSGGAPDTSPRQSAALALASLDVIDTQVWVVDASLRVLARNRAAHAAARALFGAAAAIGEPLAPSLGAPDAQRLVSHVARAFLGERGRYLCTVEHGAAQTTYVLAFAPIEGDDGEHVACAVTAHEVPRTSETTDAAPPRSTASALAEGLAHDFRNFMNVVNLDLAVLSQMANGQPTLQAICEEALTAASAATALARQVLAEGGAPTRKETMDLAALVGDARPLLAALSGRMDVVTRLDPAGPVLAAPSAIERILVQLVRNARDAMSRRGKLLVETGIVAAGSPLLGARRATEDVAVLRIVDAGGGMDAAVLARIFEPGFTTKRRGAGLGLSESADAARAYGGELLAESVLGTGTTLVLALPLERSAARSQDLGGLEILVVDDDPHVLGAMARVLEHRNAIVLTARSSVEAMALVSRVRVAVVDRNLAETSGVELAVRLRAERPGLAIVMVSGSPEVMEEARAIGVRALFKPFTPTSLVAIVAATAAEVDRTT